ncbi:MAG: peptide chain release factor N(5)-glutamine methyltransferase, partial [Deltaproteobacteria bacterium]|nr:peptide chain release factor N(5)-glutamine methyltransferase [Deltaproteobacteria bacterium]
MIETNWMIKNALRWGVDYLKDNGVDSPKLDAEILLMYSLNIDRIKLHLIADKILNAKERELYKECIERRSKRDPVAYITGHKEFMSLDFKLTKAVLVPRPETEILVEETLRECAQRKDKKSLIRILELGTGSGIIAVSLAKAIKQITLVATDISLEIIKVAVENAHLHKVNDKITFFLGRYLQGIKQKENQFDFVVSNPPYLSKSDWESAQPEIREHEPSDSLLGGEDGMDFYRTIIPDTSNLLSV